MLRFLVFRQFLFMLIQWVLFCTLFFFVPPYLSVSLLEHLGESATSGVCAIAIRSGAVFSLSLIGYIFVIKLRRIYTFLKMPELVSVSLLLPLLPGVRSINTLNTICTGAGIMIMLGTVNYVRSRPSR